jgi:hypothetical protein
MVDYDWEWGDGEDGEVNIKLYLTYSLARSAIRSKGVKN